MLTTQYIKSPILLSMMSNTGYLCKGLYVRRHQLQSLLCARCRALDTKKKLAQSGKFFSDNHLTHLLGRGTQLSGRIERSFYLVSEFYLA